MKKFKSLLLLFVLSASIIACSSDDDAPINEPIDPTTPPNLVEAAQAAGLTTLLSAVEAVDGLGETLLSASNITVFAPTNDAFGAALEAFDAQNLEELVAAIGGVGNLEVVLGFHVVPAVAFAEDLAEGDQTLNTLANQEITVNRNGATVTITDATGNVATVVTPDVEIENGVVHVINRVLLPEIELPEELPNLVEVAEAAGLTTLLAAVEAVDGLGETLLGLEAITVFAPTNDAFDDALEAFDANSLEELVAALGGVEELQAVLGIHVVPAVAFASDLNEGENTVPTLAEENLIVTRNGMNVTVTDPNGRTFNVISADVAIQNGVVHVIDGVLLTEQDEEDLPNLVEAATEAGLTTLLAAVEAVDGLGETLLGLDAITVFAPTNDAFVDALEAFNAEDLGELVAAIGGIENLETVLGFHVVPAVAFAGDLAEGNQNFTTVSGQQITVNKTGSNVTVTDAGGNVANVIAADVAIENGVVHVIDAVLLPVLP